MIQTRTQRSVNGPFLSLQRISKVQNLFNNFLYFIQKLLQYEVLNQPTLTTQLGVPAPNKTMLLALSAD